MPQESRARKTAIIPVLAIAALIGACAARGPIQVQGSSRDAGAVERGAYLAAAAGCVGCHIDSARHGPSFAGGRPIVTTFGTYYSGNITPDPATGIGNWSDGDFVRALRQGVGPDGQLYAPAFPFASFTGMNERDLLDIRAYLAKQPAVVRPHLSPERAFPFDTAPAVAVWRALYFRPGPYRSDPHETAEWNRGAYLANAVAHCGECHTPRTALGGLDDDRRFLGTMAAKSGIRAPDISSGVRHGIGAWNAGEIADFLKSGMTPQGDFAGGAMGEVIEGTSKLSDADRRAIGAYLRSATADRHGL